MLQNVTGKVILSSLSFLWDKILKSILVIVAYKFSKIQIDNFFLAFWLRSCQFWLGWKDHSVEPGNRQKGFWASVGLLRQHFGLGRPEKTQSHRGRKKWKYDYYAVLEKLKNFLTSLDSSSFFVQFKVKFTDRCV
jgi:hypothetical protein